MRQQCSRMVGAASNTAVVFGGSLPGFFGLGVLKKSEIELCAAQGRLGRGQEVLCVTSLRNRLPKQMWLQFWAGLLQLQQCA